MNVNADFHLSKWYLDCVADDGSLFIGYRASLRWKALNLHYSNMLIRLSNGERRTTTALSRGVEPELSDGVLRWEFAPFRISGEWRRLTEPVERRLLTTDYGHVTWSCHMPRARAAIRAAQDFRIEGLGYAEHLELTIPPWRLPIDELRWGRFLTDSNSLVWIDWRGNRPLTLVLRNGVEECDAAVTDTGIRRGETAILALVPCAIVRNGPVVSTMLSSIPGITRMLPGKILRMSECKWLSRGESMSCGTGWAIHECVKFP